METLAERHSTREFKPRELSDSTLANLIWDPTATARRHRL